MTQYALVTGASSGIGRAIAECIGTSRPLILAGRNASALEETKAACNSEFPHLIWQYDLSDTQHLFDGLKAFLLDVNATVDALIHSAGVARIMSSRMAEDGAVQDMMRVNFFSAVQIIRSLLQKKVNGDALENILFISSTYAVRGRAGHGLYGASKAALESYMLSLAAELAPRCRVNCIAAGAVKTKMAEEAMAAPGAFDELNERHLLGVGETKDIVHAAEYLLSDKAEWVTGQRFVIDGGLTVR